MVPEEIEAILDVAKNAQTYVTAHCQTVACANVAVDSGVHMLEHVPMIYGTDREREAVIKKIAKKGMPVELKYGGCSGRRSGGEIQSYSTTGASQKTDAGDQCLSECIEIAC